jgi:hypothetical protein
VANLLVNQKQAAGESMKRFFILLSISFLLIACIPDIVGGGTAVVGNPEATPQVVEKILSTFNLVQGTNYLMAGVIAAPVTRDSSSLNPFEWINNSRSYYDYSYSTFNYVFYNINTETYQRLLPNNDYVISQTSGFPILQYDPNNPTQPAPPIEYWVFVVVKNDTNSDNQLNHLDKLTIAISDVGGNGYTELIQNVDSVLSQYYKDNTALVVIYNADDKNYIAKINLSTRELLSTVEMDLGEDVK